MCDLCKKQTKKNYSKFKMKASNCYSSQPRITFVLLSRLLLFQTAVFSVFLYNGWYSRFRGKCLVTNRWLPFTQHRFFCVYIYVCVFRF